MPAAPGARNVRIAQPVRQENIAGARECAPAWHVAWTRAAPMTDPVQFMLDPPEYVGERAEV
jgi:hypothetical protein